MMNWIPAFLHEFIIKGTRQYYRQDASLVRAHGHGTIKSTYAAEANVLRVQYRTVIGSTDTVDSRVSVDRNAWDSDGKKMLVVV